MPFNGFAAAIDAKLIPAAVTNKVDLFIRTFLL